MDTRYKGLPGGDDRIVYVRPIAVADLPEEIRVQAEGRETIYAVHRPDGQRVALVADRATALHLARENNFAAVSVH